VLSTNTLAEIDTKLIADHFPNKKALTLLYYGKYYTLKNKILFNVGLAGFFSLVSLAILIMTFQLLEIKSLSSIPLISLFVFTILLIVTLINFLRLPIINRIIDGDLKVDKEFLRKYSMMIDYKENEINLSNKSIDTPYTPNMDGYNKID